ncbi:hypothetical protein CHL76_09320 [Marinococcus halophilus]|uniref:Uncharacterized protein n=1 Tax=Marinococcus halophilus TaxID=1371 RepID=A0A510Y4S4_MARHA|nr:hypothetical protein [Marinococcus halophilus]OZT80296.1 hypothetical protein CHL76_09320 [Marinococcus halophilus]GEK58359.1 hypothetical protein MHA01_12640 [Marinococcus halophilus]
MPQEPDFSREGWKGYRVRPLHFAGESLEVYHETELELLVQVTTSAMAAEASLKEENVPEWLWEIGIDYLTSKQPEERKRLVITVQDVTDGEVNKAYENLLRDFEAPSI